MIHRDEEQLRLTNSWKESSRLMHHSWNTMSSSWAAFGSGNTIGISVAFRIPTEKAIKKVG
jgi:hypothetical protein